jgi:hypothetical protein
MGVLGMGMKTMAETDWAKICSEIVVAVYGTQIVAKYDGPAREYAPWGTLATLPEWPLCVHPLEECSKGIRAGDGKTLHTYHYAPVPRYHEDDATLRWLETDLQQQRGWVVASRDNASWVASYMAWVNKPPMAPNRGLRKDSIKAKAATWVAAECLAIHTALMAEEND